MGLLGLGLLLAWLAVVAGGRAILARRRGEPPPLRLRDPVGTAQWWSRLISTIGFAFAVAAPIVEQVGGPPLGNAPDQPALAVVGIVLVATGAFLTLVGQAAMGASWRGDVDPDARTDLVTDGPFRYVRNPIMTGILISAAGLALVTANALSIAMCVFFLTAIEIQIRLVEEPYLLRVHGATYRAYAARVGRLVPGVGRLSG